MQHSGNIFLSQLFKNVMLTSIFFFSQETIYILRFNISCFVFDVGSDWRNLVQDLNLEL